MSCPKEKGSTNRIKQLCTKCTELKKYTKPTAAAVQREKTIHLDIIQINGDVISIYYLIY